MYPKSKEHYLLYYRAAESIRQSACGEGLNNVEKPVCAPAGGVLSLAVYELLELGTTSVRLSTPRYMQKQVSREGRSTGGIMWEKTLQTMELTCFSRSSDAQADKMQCDTIRAAEQRSRAMPDTCG